MVFSSPLFLFAFLPVTCGLYLVMPGMKSKNALLTVFSLLFYAFGQPVHVLLLLGSVAVNYVGGRLLVGTSSGRLMGACCRRGVLGVTVGLNLVLLSAFKYTDFFISTLNSVLGPFLPAPLPLTGIALPVGISFFTFQGLSYVVDVYRDPTLVSRSFGKLVLYISLFPQLIAGPIVKYHDVSQQIDLRSQTLSLTAEGLRRFILGLSKKLLLANTVGQMADLAFTCDPAQLNAGVAWLGVLCYVLQIYFDFSGYSDMAIGLGKLFGFTFLENFRYPLCAGSVQDFWRRWHISLSSWFRDYLYIPLGGNRKGKWRTAVNKCLVFFCTGLWHGASWNFVLWGLWHGAFLIGEDFLPRRSKWARALGYCTTPLVVALGFVLFRAETLEAAGLFYTQLFTGFFSSLGTQALLRSMVTPLGLFAVGVGLVASLPVIPWLERRLSASPRWKRGLEVASYGGAMLLFVLCVMNVAGAEFNPFIYFRF